MGLQSTDGGGYLYGLRPTMSTNRRKAFSGSKQNVKVWGGKELMHIQVFLKTDEETTAFFIMIYEYLWFDLIANEKT